MEAGVPQIPVFDVRVGEEELEAVAATLRSGWLSAGPQTEAFEQEFAEHLGSKHVLALSSCTAALHLACIAAAGRRMLRTTAPDEDLPGEQQVEQVTRLMIEQIERRRDFYLALVHGHAVADPRASEVMDSVRDGSTDRVVRALEVPERQRAVVRAWWAYTEDRALTWSAVPTGERPVRVSELVEECVAALHALLRISA